MCAPRSPIVRKGAIPSPKTPAILCTCIPSPVIASQYALNTTTIRKPQSPILQISSGRRPYLGYALLTSDIACRFYVGPGRDLQKRKD